MKKILLILLVLISLLAFTYILGPRYSYDAINFKIEALDIPIEKIESHIASKESNELNLKPDNEARIIWAGKEQIQTDFAIVYLHGFSASPMESKPTHLDLAKKYGCNMYLARLSEHGIEDQESFKTLQPAALVESAKEALAIGRIIGKKIILMSCSTGSTLAVPLKSHNPEYINAQIMLSPNFSLADPKASLITGPWGKQLAQYVNGSSYRKLRLPKSCRKYWTNKYRLEGVLSLQALIDECVKDEYFQEFSDPNFIGVYYKNEKEKDKIISIDAARKYHGQMPSKNKIYHEFKNVGSHVLASQCQSRDISEVEVALNRFMEVQLGLSPS